MKFTHLLLAISLVSMGGALPVSSSWAQEGSVLADYVVIQKKERVVALWSEGKIIRSYRIMAMGDDPQGPKYQEGDERTPEGHYTIDEKHISQHFQKFLNISYPNEADKKWAKTHHVKPGGNVGIHGDRGGLSGFFQRFEANWTNGCISLQNHDIDEMYDLVPVGTPIWIKP